MSSVNVTGLFAQPERLSVEYIELNPAQYALPVDESELEAQLADALADYETKAQSEVAIRIFRPMPPANMGCWGW